LWHTAPPEPARANFDRGIAYTISSRSNVNPPEDKGPNPETPEQPSGVWLPPRLREKLEQPTSGDEFDFLKRKSSPVGPIITGVLIVAIIAGAWWIFQNNKRKEAEAAAARAAVERAAFVADSLAKVRMADSLVAVARADSIAFAALPKWKQRQILAERAKLAAAARASTSPPPAAAGGATGAAASPGATGAGAAGTGGGTEAAPETPPEPGPFGIDAGQFLDEARAGEVAAELKEKTGLAAAIVPMGEGDELAYHVVLGSYPGRAAAESKANSLLAKSLLSEASVVKLPKSP